MFAAVCLITLLLSFLCSNSCLFFGCFFTVDNLCRTLPPHTVSKAQQELEKQVRKPGRSGMSPYLALVVALIAILITLWRLFL